MSKKLRIVFHSIFWMVNALYLGFALWSVFLKTFMADTLEFPSVLVSAVGFLFVLRWLSKEEVASAKTATRVAKPQRRKTGFLAPDQQHVFRARKKNATCWQTVTGMPVNRASQQRCVKMGDRLAKGKC